MFGIEQTAGTELRRIPPGRFISLVKSTRGQTELGTAFRERGGEYRNTENRMCSPALLEFAANIGPRPAAGEAQKKLSLENGKRKLSRGARSSAPMTETETRSAICFRRPRARARLRQRGLHSYAPEELPRAPSACAEKSRKNLESEEAWKTTQNGAKLC